MLTKSVPAYDGWIKCGFALAGGVRVQRAGVPGAESSVVMRRCREPVAYSPYYSFGGNPGAESCDRPEVQRAGRPPGAESRESRRRRTRLVVLKGGHRDAWPLRKGNCERRGS